VAIAGVCEVIDPPLVARVGGGLVACHHEPVPEEAANASDLSTVHAGS
jgi:hypothetical protein